MVISGRKKGEESHLLSVNMFSSGKELEFAEIDR